MSRKPTRQAVRKKAQHLSWPTNQEMGSRQIGSKRSLILLPSVLVVMIPFGYFMLTSGLASASCKTSWSSSTG